MVFSYQEVIKMLLQFNCKNFKSYRDEFSLDMIGTSIKEHQDNLIIAKKEEKYLKTIAIYGANASGKSNTIEAFEHMQYLVLSSFSEASKRKLIPLKRFVLTLKVKFQIRCLKYFFHIKIVSINMGFL